MLKQLVLVLCMWPLGYAAAAKTPANPSAEKTAPVIELTPASDEPAVPAEMLINDENAPVQYGIGAQVRANFIPAWLLNWFLESSTSATSVAFGGEFVRRKGNFDLVAAVDFGFYGPQNGNYLGRGKDPVTDTDYMQFKNLSALGFSIHGIWHHHFTKWLSFIYGGGLGLGVVFGNVLRVSNDPARCNVNNFANEDQCYPRGMDPKRRDEWLADDRNQGTPDEDTPKTPKVFKQQIWPVVPIIHIMAGLNFKISEHFNIRVDGGIRNAFYVGAAGHYFF